MAPSPLSDELNNIRRRARELLAGLTPEQIAERPEAAKWSIGECLAHLNATAAVVQPIMAKGIEHGRKANIVGEGPFPLGPKGRLLIWIATPPPKFRFRAPKSVAPPVKVPEPSQLLADFMRVQDDWQQLMKDAEGLDLGRIRVGPRLSPFRCRLSASFPWMMAHQSRHLLQAENVKKQLLQAKPASA